MAKAKPSGLIEEIAAPDPFYRDRDAHLIEVARNGKLSKAAKSIASILAIQFANRERYLAGDSRVAWPSVGTLAKILGLHPDTVKDGLKELEAYGHHKVDRPKVKGRGRVNGYRFVVKGAANGGEKTPIKNGGEKTPNYAKNGGLQPSKKGVKTPPELIEEQPEGAGARSRAPQAPEQTDVSFSPDDQKNSDQSNVAGDLDTHERVPSPDPATDLPEQEFDPDPIINDAESDLEIPSDLSRQWEEADAFQTAPAIEDQPDFEDDDFGDEHPESTEPDEATLQTWSFAWNSVAFKVLADLPDLAKINIFDPPDLVVACALFPDVLPREISRDLPRALVGALPVNSANRSEALGYLRVAMLRLPDLDPATAAAAHQRLLAAIEAAAPRPAKERHSAHQVREASNG